MKNNDGKYIIIICCFIVYAAGTESTNIECKVDYRGIVHFNVNLPEGYHSWNGLYPMFYYKSISNWRQEADCIYVNNNTVYRCAMHELTNKERSLEEKLAGYEFKLSILVNTTITNVTIMYFTSNKNITVAPWNTLDQLSYCADGYGVKYIAANASYNSINIEWILFPIDADLFRTFKSSISIKGIGIDPSPRHIDKSTNCKDDLCKYNIKGLTPCSEYKICFETDGNSEKEEEKKRKCRDVHTYCGDNTSEKNSVKWQDTLLCVFGAIMLIICIVMLWALFNKHTRFGGMFTDNNCQNEIVNQEDLVNPVPVLNIHNIHYVDNEHLYHYPYGLVTELTSTTITDNIEM